VWAPASQLKGLFVDEDIFRIYTGLLYQQSRIRKVMVYRDRNDGGTAFTTLLDSFKSDLFYLQMKIEEFSNLAANVNTAYVHIKAKVDSSEKPTDDDVYNYINTSIDVIDYGLGICQKLMRQPEEKAGFVSMARNANTLFRDLYSKQYSRAVDDALAFFGSLNGIVRNETDFDALAKQVNSLNYSGAGAAQLRNLAAKNLDYASACDDVSAVAGLSFNQAPINELVTFYLSKRLQHFLETVRPYALFIGNIVEAKGEDDVKSALDNAILPVGSSSIKKYAAGFGNLSVQSYLGAYGSLKNAANSDYSTWSNRFGVTAPIGISWTPGFASRGKWGSFSLFASLIDLGAIVDRKLRVDSVVSANGTVQKNVVVQDYTIRLGNIFSPGASLVYGFGANIPLALGFGMQYGPGLSSIQDDNNIVVGQPAWRMNVFLAVDIPLFTLKHKNKQQ
jgi:hypothetical protein